MTSNQCRREGDRSTGSSFPQVALVGALWEIAAQLAELNERLRDDRRAIPVALYASNDDIPVRVKS